MLLLFSKCALNQSGYCCVKQGGIVDCTVRELNENTSAAGLKDACRSARSCAVHA